MPNTKLRRQTKLNAYLARSDLLNQFGTVCSSREVLEDQQIIVLNFASVHDTDVDLQERLRRLYDTVRHHEGPHVPRLEIVHVPVDNVEEQGRRCFAEQAGLWYTIPPCSGTVFDLLMFFNVVGTPTVKAIAPDGEYISRYAADDLRKYGTNALCRWY